jgi:Domain of unknown function (DUF4193)
MKEEETVQEPENAAPEPAEASLDEIATKAEEAGDEDEGMISTGREERVETLAVKVVPQQPTEFVCKNCYLVKHRSQLADKKRMFCRDCA